ncbi:cell wall metabolism sensor histidine kinase WalK [Paenibacillus sp. IB182496]|uniref:histidine kinase n=1 Tax=Paenibacillus sabuli TaxID=2772509 RepID=A0A927GSV1_9BACL|nr:cell wall metabolism sensor histidine kinase WalK [Paenibacillus sabuli]MBD2846420.1 cell wall metabolism sensor histidine kinase WalK [Paenibacillus sabuli]
MKGIRIFRTIQVKLIIIYVLLILIAMQLIGVYFITTMKTSVSDSFSKNLNDQANMLANIVEQTLSPAAQNTDVTYEQTIQDLRSKVNALFSINEAEIQVLDASGKVLMTSVQSQQSYVGRKNTTLAVNRALQGFRDNEEDIIDDDNVRKKVIARPAFYQGKVVGAVYIVASMYEVYETINRVNRIFVTGMLLALGLTAVLGVLLSHTITSPIKVLTRQATAVAEGRFDRKVPVHGEDEIGQLSEAFNNMTQRLQEALSVNEEEKEKLASILSNMSDGVVAADERGVVIVTNRRAREMLGVKQGEGLPLAELVRLEPQRIEELLRGFEHAALIRTDTLEQTEGEGGIIRVTFTPISRRDKTTAGTIAVLQDVTEQEKLEQSRREFVANVSHELRTPLTTIKSYAEALEDGAMQERELGERFVGVIRNETERMIRLVTDLLHLSRLDSSQSAVRRQATNIQEMLEEVADRFSFQLRQKAIRATVEAEPDLPPIRLDRDQIDQVLDNLVSNAIKYTMDGGRIAIRARRPDPASVAIAVQDTGIGIPQKDLNRIFERFYRVDKARSRNMGGTGLGLSIAREIIKAHGGTVTLESEWNEGTTVTFTLPALQEGDGA